jgi:cell wall-associated NlpC family hydrolase
LSPPQTSQQAAGQDENSEDQSVRHRLVEAGFQFLGVRYRFGSVSEQSGFDCSGLVKSVFSKFDIELPRTSREQFKQGEKVDRNNLKKGDLVFFSSGGKTPNHVGIYVGDNQFLHAARKARQVIVSDLNKIWYSMRYLGARRVIEEKGEPAAPEQSN